MADGLEEVSPDLHKRAKFWSQQYADALSPSNFAATNPEVLQEIARTGGTNLLQGMQNLMSDLQQGQVSMVPDGAFEVGKDLAVTPGKVVYRNPLIELIQYEPATEQVREIPILAIPPWINKYYVMDMRPENSMYQYLVEAGFTLFTISWKNPDDSVLDLEWADYMEMGVMDALRVVKAITGADKVNTLGYCLGGIVQQVTLAYLAAKGEDPVNTATYFRQPPGLYRHRRRGRLSRRARGPVPGMADGGQRGLSGRPQHGGDVQHPAGQRSAVALCGPQLPAGQGATGL